MITEDLARLELNAFAGAGSDLVFLGEPTGTVIVSAVGRGWLPLEPPAEKHPVNLTVAGAPKGVVRRASQTVRRAG